MGKRVKKTAKQKRKLTMQEKPRKVTKTGKLKRKRGDLRVTTQHNVAFSVKQKKGGKWIRVSDRKCQIHTVCNCVALTDPAKMQRITNR